MDNALDNLFIGMKESYKKTFGSELSTEVRDDSFIKVLDNGTVDNQENKVLKLMYGGTYTNHQLAKELHIPITSACRTTCGMRKPDKGYLFNIEKIWNEETQAQNALMGLTPLGKKIGQNLLWQDFHNKKVGSNNELWQL